MTEEATFDRNQITELLLLAREQERTVIEFQKRGGTIYAMDVTQHMEELEEIVNDEKENKTLRK